LDNSRSPGERLNATQTPLPGRILQLESGCISQLMDNLLQQAFQVNTNLWAQELQVLTREPHQITIHSPIKRCWDPSNWRIKG